MKPASAKRTRSRAVGPSAAHVPAPPRINTPVRPTSSARFVQARQGHRSRAATCNTFAMNLHLAEIAKHVAPGAHVLARRSGRAMSTTACQVRHLAPSHCRWPPGRPHECGHARQPTECAVGDACSPTSSIAAAPPWVMAESGKFAGFGKLPCCIIARRTIAPPVRAFHASFAHHLKLAEGIGAKLAHLPDTVNCQAVERKDCRPYSPHRLCRGPSKPGGNGVR